MFRVRLLAAVVLVTAIFAPGVRAEVSGVVEGTTGQPLGGASVWVISSAPYYAQGQVLGVVVSDSQGRFLVHQQITPSHDFRLLAYLPGYGLGFLRLAPYVPRVRMTLLPAGSGRVLVMTPDGDPLPQASAELTNLRRAPGGWGESGAQWCGLPEALAAKFPLHADAQGWIALPLGPLGTEITLRLHAPGWAEAQYSGEPRGDVSVIPERPGSLAGRLVCPRAAAVSGRRVHLGQMVTEGPYPAHRGADFTITTAADGSFRRDDLPAGRYRLSVDVGADDEWQPLAGSDFTVTAGKLTTVAVPYVRAYRAVGRVVDPQGHGVAGLGVWVNQGGGRGEQEAVTDEEGRVTFRALLGGLSYRALTYETGYTDVDGKSEGRATVTADEPDHLPTIKVGPGVIVAGEVVDGSGRAVAVALVLYRNGPAEGNYEQWHPALTDDQGRFRVRVPAEGGASCRCGR